MFWEVVHVGQENNRPASWCQGLLLSFFSPFPVQSKEEIALISICFESLWCEISFPCAFPLCCFSQGNKWGPVYSEAQAILIMKPIQEFGDALAQGLSAENTNPPHWALPPVSWLLFPCSLKFLPISLRKGWNPRWWPSKGLGVRKKYENTAFWKGNCWSFNICEHANFPKFHNLLRAGRNRRWESTVTFTVELFSCPFWGARGGILVLALFEWVPLKAHLCWLYLVDPALHDWATH